MIFVGQRHIMTQLRFLLPDLYKNPQHGANILLRGPSGYGKTTMAISIAHYLAGKYFEFYLGSWTEFRFEKRVVFIDEVHTMKNFEVLFPIMDKKIHVFIFATNQDANLPEAFTNRCFEYVFDDYGTDDLLIIARESAFFSAPDSAFLEIIEAGNRNPRIIKSLVDRFSIFFSENPSVNPLTADYKKMLTDIFSIKDGMDTLCRRYIEVLNDVGGNASISLLKSILHVDEGTLKNQVEPVLLRKGIIRISSKGRSLVYDSQH
jgi:Holliday junction resolvasome RuvABC ATP-dependent DNA helicase subunit